MVPVSLIVYLILSGHVAVASAAIWIPTLLSWGLTILDCYDRSDGVDETARCILKEAAGEVEVVTNAISCFKSDDLGEMTLCFVKQIAKESDIIYNAIGCYSKSSDPSEMIVCFVKETAKTYLQKLCLGVLKRTAINAFLRLLQWSNPKLKRIK